MDVSLLLSLQGGTGAPGFPGIPGDPGIKGEKVQILYTQCRLDHAC